MKALGWVVIAVVLVLAAVAIYVVVYSGTLIERAIERQGSAYLGVSVEVAEVEVALRDGVAVIRGLVVGNPPGFTGPPAIRVDEIHMNLNIGQTSSELIVFEEMAVEGTAITALLRRQESNLQQIMDHLNREISARERAEPIRVAPEVKLIIDRFALRDATATVRSDLFGEASVTVPPIHLDDIGRARNGATVGQVLRQVLEPLFRAVLGAATEGRARERIEGAREQVEGRLERALEDIGNTRRREE
ncbi:MAG: hypothetical protein ACNA7W_08785 [Pseudomonadales bacterium]